MNANIEKRTIHSDNSWTISFFIIFLTLVFPCRNFHHIIDLLSF
jgi:hypothetical protein